MAERWRDGEQILLVETYGPAAEPPPALRPGASMGSVLVHGAIAVPGDEVVFYLVSGPSEAEVKRAFAGLGLQSLRIVPAVLAGRLTR